MRSKQTNNPGTTRSKEPIFKPRKVTSVLHAGTILSPWNPKSDNGSPFSATRTAKVTTVLHFRTRKPCEQKKTHPKTTYSKSLTFEHRKQKVTTVNTLTRSYLLGTFLEMTTVPRFEHLEPQKWRLFCIFAPENHANKEKKKAKQPAPKSSILMRPSCIITEVVTKLP